MSQNMGSNHYKHEESLSNSRYYYTLKPQIKIDWQWKSGKIPWLG